MKKFFIFSLIFSQIFIGCGENSAEKNPPPKKIFDLSQAKDGTFSAESSRDEKLGKSILTLTIKDKKLSTRNLPAMICLEMKKIKVTAKFSEKTQAIIKRRKLQRRR